MVFDANAYIGNYALRELRHNTAEGLLALMDRKGIDRALVSSAEAIMFQDAHAGNALLHREIADHRDRLVPCAVLNPAYAGWEQDLRMCAEELGMPAVKLYPHWHGYRVADRCCAEIVDAAAELGLLVTLPIRAQDARQLGWLFDIPDLPLSEVAALIRSHPHARFAILEGIGITGSALVTERASMPDNYWVEISRMGVFLGKEIPALMDALGPGRLLFGTGMPFKYVDPVLLKMQHLDACEEDKDVIWGANLQGLLKQR